MSNDHEWIDRGFTFLLRTVIGIAVLAGRLAWRLLDLGWRAWVNDSPKHVRADESRASGAATWAVIVVHFAGTALCLRIGTGVSDMLAAFWAALAGAMLARRICGRVGIPLTWNTLRSNIRRDERIGLAAAALLAGLAMTVAVPVVSTLAPVALVIVLVVAPVIGSVRYKLTVDRFEQDAEDWPAHLLRILGGEQKVFDAEPRLSFGPGEMICQPALTAMPISLAANPDRCQDALWAVRPGWQFDLARSVGDCVVAVLADDATRAWREGGEVVAAADPVPAFAPTTVSQVVAPPVVFDVEDL